MKLGHYYCLSQYALSLSHAMLWLSNPDLIGFQLLKLNSLSLLIHVFCCPSFFSLFVFILKSWEMFLLIWQTQSPAIMLKRSGLIILDAIPEPQC